MGNMRFKVGDRVRIKSIDWYNENKDNLSFYTDSMALCFANEIVTIKSYGRYPNTYRIDEDEGDFLWTDEMIEGLVEEEKKISIKLTGKAIKNNEMDVSVDEYILPEGYILKDENGNVINATKIVLEKKNKEYPKTYEECLSVLGIYNGLPDVEIYNAKPSECKLFESLIRLKRCRDAYWKLAGEEIGMGKPWEPDWDKDEWPDMAYISYDGKSIDKENGFPCCNMILIFPTDEMRDAFYENFKSEIEICKELL